MASPLEQAKRAYQRALRQKRKIDKKNSAPLKRVRQRKEARQIREAAAPKTRTIRQSTQRLKQSRYARGVSGFAQGFARGFSFVPVTEDKTGAFNGLTATQRQNNPKLNAAVQKRVAKAREERDKIINESKEGKLGTTVGYGAGAIASAMLTAPITSAIAGKALGTKLGRKVVDKASRKVAAAASEKAAEKHLSSALLRKALAKAAKGQGLAGTTGDIVRTGHNAVRGAAKNIVQDVIYDKTFGAAKDVSNYVASGRDPRDNPKEFAKYMLENEKQNIAYGAAGNILAPAVGKTLLKGRFTKATRVMDDIPNAQGKYSSRIVKQQVPVRSAVQADALQDADYIKYLKTHDLRTGKLLTQGGKRVGKSLGQVAREEGKSILDVITDNYTPEMRKIVQRSLAEGAETTAKSQADNVAATAAKQQADEGATTTAKGTAASKSVGESKKLSSNKMDDYKPYIPQYAVGGKYGTNYIPNSPTRFRDFISGRTAEGWLKRHTVEGGSLEYAAAHNMEPSDVLNYARDKIAESLGYRKLTSDEQQSILDEIASNAKRADAAAKEAPIPSNVKNIETPQGTKVNITREAGDTGTAAATKQARPSATKNADKEYADQLNDYVNRNQQGVSEPEPKPGEAEMPKSEIPFEKPHTTQTDTDSQAVSSVRKHLRDKPEIQKQVSEYLDTSKRGKKYTESNNDAIEYATKRIEKYGETQVSKSMRIAVEQGHGLTNEDIAAGVILMDKWADDLTAVKRVGDTKAATRIQNDIDHLAATLVQGESDAGRRLQAAKLLAQASPEGRVRSVRMMVARLKKEKGLEELNVDDDLMNMLKHATKESDIQTIQEAIAIDVWDQIPGTLNEKFGAFRYISMLLNPRTHIRNITGNAAFVPVRKVRDTLEGGLQTVFNKRITSRGAKRTQTIVNPFSDSYKRNMQGGLQEWDGRKQTFYANNNKISLNQERPQESIKYMGRVGGALNKINSAGLNVEDEMFAAPAYQKAFANYLEANKLDYAKATKEDIEAASKYAYDEALEATYRAKNELADLLNKIRRNANLSWGGTAQSTRKLAGIALDTIAPFTNTPINILKTGAVDFNPAQAIRGIYHLGRARTGQEVLDGIRQLSNGMTGTGLYALGIYLAHKKIATASINGDDQGYYDRDKGYQDYSFTIGKTTFGAGDLLDMLSFGRDPSEKISDDKINLTMDWAMPAALPLFMGVEAYNAFAKDDADDKDPESEAKFIGRLGKYVASLPKMLDPVFNMSMLSSFTNVLDTSDAEKNGVSPQAQIGLNLADSRFGQYTPTVIRQAANVMADARHNTKSVNAGVEGWAEGFARRQIDKVPVVGGMVNPDKTNAFGEKVKGKENATDRLLSAVENFISPANVRKIRETDVDKEAQRLIDNGQPIGEVAPQTAYINQVPTGFEGKKFKLTTKDLEEFNRIRGQKNLQSLSALIKTKEYKQASDQEKAKMYKETYDQNTTEAKQEFLKSKGISIPEQQRASMSEEERARYDEKAAELKKVGIDNKKYETIYNNVENVKRSKNVSYSSTGMYVARTMAAVEGGIRKYKQAAIATDATEETWRKVVNLYNKGFSSNDISKLALDSKTSRSLKGTTKTGKRSQYIDNKKLMLYVNKQKISKRQKWAMYEINKQDRYNMYPNPF